jgi:hypothetical protein
MVFVGGWFGDNERFPTIRNHAIRGRADDNGFGGWKRRDRYRIKITNASSKSRQLSRGQLIAKLWVLVAIMVYSASGYPQFFNQRGSENLVGCSRPGTAVAQQR